VFVALGNGWLADAASGPEAGDIEAHPDEVSATDDLTVPELIVDEVLQGCDRRVSARCPTTPR
jgi:hypothetical protein